ncbi:ZinT/AdcA family metal-binding protein, partial [Salmonella enterica]|uniref:ZinT/AdcA family metal-binding protein n=1 Tax=Salmonella enterica TaxID=28901 RepID=UPI003D330BB2
PYLVSGELDPVYRQKAKKDPEKTFEDIKANYRKGYVTNVETIGIENGVIEFHRDYNVASCKFNYAGYKILTYASG